MRFTFTSILPRPASVVWDQLQQSDTLSFVAAGMVTYDSVETWPKQWRVGTRVNLRPRLFGCLPPSDHMVEFVRLDPAQREIETNESGGMITRWDHTMRVESLNDRTSRYVDTLVIEASPFATPSVWLFTQFFYRHRHRRWHKLLARMTTE